MYLQPHNLPIKTMQILVSYMFLLVRTRYDLSSLRILGTVGEPINPEAWHWYHEAVGQGRCPVVDTFWQTETVSVRELSVYFKLTSETEETWIRMAFLLYPYGMVYKIIENMKKRKNLIWSPDVPTISANTMTTTETIKPLYWIWHIYSSVY